MIQMNDGVMGKICNAIDDFVLIRRLGLKLRIYIDSIDLRKRDIAQNEFHDSIHWIDKQLKTKTEQ